MMLQSRIAIAIATCCFALQAQGAPRISSLSGDVSTGNSVIIKGADFGNRPDTPIFFDVTDMAWINGTERHPYAALRNRAEVPAGRNKLYRDNVYGFFSLIRADSTTDGDFSYYHATIGKNRWGAAQDAWLSTPTAVPEPASGKLRRLYMSWLVRLSFASNSRHGPRKFIRIWDTLSGKAKDIHLAWSETAFQYQGGADTSWGDVHVKANYWSRLELLVDADRGRIEAWVNGDKVHDVVDFSPRGNNGLQPRLIGWDASGDIDYLGETVDLARIYIDSSAARVELCDAPVWRQCSTREIQMSSSWGEDQIRVRLSPGRLKTLRGKYLYVVNSRGQVNSEGFQVCGQCPEAPGRIVRRQRQAGR